MPVAKLPKSEGETDSHGVLCRILYALAGVAKVRRGVAVCFFFCMQMDIICRVVQIRCTGTRYNLILVNYIWGRGEQAWLVD